MPESAADKVGLVIAAHPDDPEFGAGGTAAVFTAQGWTMHYLVVTNGAKGSGDPGMTPERLIPLREQEQRAAAETLGVVSCTFLGGEDGELDYSRAMLGKIVREIRRLKPYAIFTHSSEKIHWRPFRAPEESADDAPFLGFVNHRDHRNTGEMTLDAVYPTARDRLNFPEHLAEGLETHQVRELYFWGAREPNYSVDISDMIDRKISALTKHVSQFGDRNEGFIKTIKERWVDEDGKFYERFQRLILPG